MEERKGRDPQAEPEPEQRLVQPDDAIEDIEPPGDESENVRGGNWDIPAGTATPPRA